MLVVWSIQSYDKELFEDRGRFIGTKDNAYVAGGDASEGLMTLQMLPVTLMGLIRKRLDVIFSPLYFTFFIFVH